MPSKIYKPEKKKEYYLNNKEEISKKRKQHYLKNRDKIRQRQKQYCERNKELIQRLNREYRNNNLKQIAENNRIYFRNRYRSDIQYRLKNILRARLNAAVKGNFRSGSAVRDLGCTIEKFKRYLESLFKSGMSWGNYGSLWQIDHIISLSSFDLTDRGQLLSACNYKNLQPMFSVDNLRKSDR